MAKRMTPEERRRYDIRERLIAYYKKSGKTQEELKSEIPCSLSMLSPALQRQRPITRAAALAFETYLDRMEG